MLFISLKSFTYIISSESLSILCFTPSWYSISISSSWKMWPFGTHNKQKMRFPNYFSIILWAIGHIFIVIACPQDSRLHVVMQSCCCINIVCNKRVDLGDIIVSNLLTFFLVVNQQVLNSCTWTTLNSSKGDQNLLIFLI